MVWNLEGAGAGMDGGGCRLRDEVGRGKGGTEMRGEVSGRCE